MLQRLTQAPIALLLLVSSAHGAVELTFRDNVRTANSSYTLDDVAQIRSVDVELEEALGSIVLGDTPRPGQSVAVTQYAVGARLERVMPGINERIQWLGDSVVRVRGEGIERDGTQMTSTARTALLEWLQQHDGLEVGIRAIGKAMPYLTPVGGLELSARLPASMQIRPRMSVWVDIFVDGHRVQTQPVWFAVEAYTEVAVATQDLSAHAEITPAEILFERRDIAGLSAAPVVDEIPERHRVRHRVSAGDVVLASTLEPIPPVQKGEMITVFARHGRVALAVEARALDDGRLDESVLVENLNSRSAYRAIVSGIRQATVE